MNAVPSPQYTFGPYRLDPQERLLLRDGQPVPLSPKAFEMLMVLVRHSGRLVEKELLLKEVWPDTFVEEGNLTVHMSALRKALGDAGDAGTVIETVPRRGYRFLLPVEQQPAPHTSVVMERHVETRIVREEIEEIAPGSARTWRAIAVVTIVLLLVVAVFAWRMTSTVSAPAALRVTPFASYSTGVYGPSFAPDGERIAFAWQGSSGNNWDIYVKVIGNEPPLRLTQDPFNDGFPTWSPDGRQIAFLRESRDKIGIYVVGAMGGGERKLADIAFGRYYDLEWSPDGQAIIFAQKTDPREPYNSNRSLAIFRLTLATGEKKQLTFPADPERDDRFALSSDGRTLAFLRHNNSGSSILHIPVEGGAPSPVHSEPNWIGHIAWTADDRAIIFSSMREGGSKLFRIAAAGGTPNMLPLADAEAYFPAVARRGGRMAYVRSEFDSDLYRIELSGPGGAASKAVAIPSSGRTETAPEFSPDGKRLAFFSEGSGRRELWLSNADGSNAAPLTDFHAATTFAPSWSPDGKQLAFASLHGPKATPGGVFAIDVNTREIRRLSDDAYSTPSWSHDGQWIYLAANPFYTHSGIWKVPAQGGAPIEVTRSPGLLAQESPDGRTLFYFKLHHGIWKMPLPNGPETQVVPGYGRRSCWRVVQDGIYLRSSEAIEFFDLASGKPRVVASKEPLETADCDLTVAPDRRSIVFSRISRSTSEIVLVENFN